MKKLFIQLVCVVMLFSVFAPVFANTELVPMGAQTQNSNLEMAPVGVYSAQDKPWYEDTADVWWNSTWGSFGQYGYGTRGVKAVTGQNVSIDPLGAAQKAVFEPIVEGVSKLAKHAIYAFTWGIAKVASWITWVIGQIFDILLIRLTPTNENDGTLRAINSSIESSWKIIRDVASIIIIFSLLYLGIKTILDGNGFADKKTLVSIIVAAILLNFSLLLVRDVAFFVSNRVGNEILKTAVLSNTDGGGSFSAAMLNMVGPQSLFKMNIKNVSIDSAEAAQFAGQEWDVVFMFVAQVGILNFVLFIAVLIYAGLIILLLIRFIIFVILMITAPLGIIAFTIPWIKSHGKMWWEELKKQTIFFPAFVFTMYIVFLIIGTLGSGANLGQISLNSDVSTGNVVTDFLNGTINGAVGFFLNFALIIGFMIVLLIVPGKLSKGGASVMGKTTKWANGKIRSYAAGATFGGAAMIGRNTVGRIASRTLSSDKLRSDSQKTGGIFSKEGRQGMVARALLNRADKAQDYSFDARSTKFGGEMAKKYGLGTAQSGWKTTVENKTKAYKTKMDKEKKLYGFGEDLPNAGKSRAEIKNMAVKDVLQKSIEADRREVTRLQTSTNPRDEKKAEKLADTIAKKEAKLATVYMNQDKFDKDRTDKQDEDKKAKAKQIENANKVVVVEEKKLEELKKAPESESKAAQIKVQEEAIKLRKKEVTELETEHDTIGVSPKEKHAKEVEVAKAQRDNTAKELKDAQKALAEAVKNKQDVSGIMKQIGEHEKSLGEYETEVGRLMNRGADQYLKFAEKQRKSITNLMGASRTDKAALEKLAKDAKKEWKEKGKANMKSEKKDKKDTTTTNTTSAILGPDGNTARPSAPSASSGSVILGSDGRSAR